jgi:tripartite-type tricarboxylate transporter receptor subunit TctC
VVSRLHAAIVKVMLQPEVKSRLAAGGVEVTVSASPAEFAAFMQRETDRWAKVVKDAGITPE